jgi:hypothetical protein
MGLLDKIKNVEQAAHKGWDDIEARMRHRWRVYPNRRSTASTPTTQVDDFLNPTDPANADSQASQPINPGDLLEMMARAELAPLSKPTSDIPQKSPAPDDERKPIVSIKGKDVDEKELEKGESKNKNVA